MSGDEGESRSDRLRRRRSQRQEDSDANDGSDPNSEDETNKNSETDSSSKPSKQSVKDEQTPVYMYLPESQNQEINRLYNVLKAEYEYEYSEDFEKNRHFYPLLIQYGLESLDGLDALEIQEHLERMS